MGTSSTLKSFTSVFSFLLAIGLGAKDLAATGTGTGAGAGTKGLISPSYLTSATYPVTSSALYLFQKRKCKKLGFVTCEYTLGFFPHYFLKKNLFN